MRSLRHLRRRLPWLLVVLLSAALAARSLPFGGGGGGAERATVVRAVDGDTVIARLAGGREERVRYIGMDTPEDVKPGTPVQCYSRAAAARNRALVQGRRVVLRFDAERRDRYGRLLAYVYRRPGNLFVNARLVAEGYARAYPYPPNTAHAGEFASLARRARSAGRGLWSRC